MKTDDESHAARPQQSTAVQVGRALVFGGLVVNVAIAAFVLTMGALKPQSFRLDPMGSLVLLAMLSFPAVLAATSLAGRPAMRTEAALTSLLAAPLSFAG